MLEEDLDATQKAKAKRTRLEALIGSEARVNNVARDVVAHFEARQAVFFGKGLIVTMSRPVAAAMYAAIVALRPDWHSDDLQQGKIKVVMTGNASDGPELARLHTTAKQRRRMAARMKDDADNRHQTGVDSGGGRPYFRAGKWQGALHQGGDRPFQSLCHCHAA